MAPRGTPQTSHVPAAADLSVADMYLQLADSRTSVIEQILDHATQLPEPPALTLTMAAATLAHVRWDAYADHGRTAQATAVARRLTAEAARHDATAGALAERSLVELEETAELYGADLLREAADALLWCGATLRHLAWLSVEDEEGNVAQLELAWLCLVEAADLLLGADRAAIAEREVGGT